MGTLFPCIVLLLLAVLAAGHALSGVLRPSVEFLERTTFDFGRALHGETVSHRFKFQ